jgi:hypothetical protein
MNSAANSESSARSAGNSSGSVGVSPNNRAVTGSGDVEAHLGKVDPERVSARARHGVL